MGFVINLPTEIMNSNCCRAARIVLTLFIGMCGTLAVGCSSFNREWAGAAKASPSATGMIGRWEGRWSSEANQHAGRLRCLVTPAGNGNFIARFHAKYGKIFSFGYSVALAVQETNSEFQFQGDANLGWYAGGNYHYEGRVVGTNFFATYRCKADHGTFQMARPSGP